MKRILITGASRGIGKAIALAVAGQDSELLLHGRATKALDAVAEQAGQRGSKTKVITADLTDSYGIDTIVDAVGDAELTALVHNAAVAIVKPFNELSSEDWQRTLDVNVTAPFELTRRLRSQIPRGGTVVNILSVAARSVFPGWSAYCMSKFALDGFARAIREELRADGIRVVSLYPKASATEMWDGISGEFDRSKMLDPSEVGRAVAYVLSASDEILIDSIDLGNIAGNL